MTEQQPQWAVTLREERERRGWSKPRMARELLRAIDAPPDSSRIESLVRQIRGWENGLHFPVQWGAAYAVAFDLAEDELFDTAGSVNLWSDDADEDWEDMERRRLLQALATLGVTSSPVFDALQNIRAGVDRTLERDENRHVDEWEETVAEYGYSYMLDPPHRLLTSVAADLVTVQQIMVRKKRRDPMYPSWCRVTSGLATIMAKTLCNLGQPQLARDWWTTAQWGADTARDSDLSTWIGAERLVHGLYERRPTPVLLRKANEIAKRSSGTPGRGLVHVLTIHAQLLALDGQHETATKELHRSSDEFERLSTSVTNDVQSIAGWAEDRLRYTEAWVYAYLGEREQLDAAVNRAQEILPADLVRARVQMSLLQAFGHVRAGDVTEGVRHAQAVYEAHPEDQRTTMVTSLADQVLEAVPARSLGEPTVIGYRELLGSGAQRRAIT